MNAIDKVITYLNPIAGAKRETARKLIEAMRAYDGASNGARTSNWKDSRGSANAETQIGLVALRARARELERNNPYAKRAIEVIANNTIGAGIRPSHQGLTDNQRKRVKEAWAAWAETKQIDFNGQMDVYALQRHVMAAVARDGECFIVRRVNPKGNIPFQLQVLEADYVTSDYYPNLNIERGNYVVQGIEFNAQGKRVAYWMYEQHPGDPYIYANSTLVPKRITAENVAHVYRADRPGQVRGIPFGVSAMVKIRDFEEYQDAELVRRKVASLMVAFVSDSVSSSITSGSKNSFPSTMMPGSILETKPGQTVTLATPPSVDGYAEYSRVVLQSIASAYGVTYEALTGNLADVNFSSGRMGWLEFHRNVQDWQYNLIVPMMCDVLYEWFRLGLDISGVAKSPAMNAQWTAPRREMIDPVKEVKAMNDAIRSGLMSRQEAIRALGSEPSEVLKEFIEDAKDLDAAKLMFDSDPRFDAARKAENPPNSKPNN